MKIKTKTILRHIISHLPFAKYLHFVCLPNLILKEHYILSTFEIKTASK